MSASGNPDPRKLNLSFSFCSRFVLRYWNEFVQPTTLFPFPLFDFSFILKFVPVLQTFTVRKYTNAEVRMGYCCDVWLKRAGLTVNSCLLRTSFFLANATEMRSLPWNRFVRIAILSRTLFLNVLSSVFVCRHWSQDQQHQSYMLHSTFHNIADPFDAGQTQGLLYKGYKLRVWPIALPVSDVKAICYRRHVMCVEVGMQCKCFCDIKSLGPWR